MHGAIAGDAGIVDDDLHRPQILGNLGQRVLALLEIADIEFVDGDAGLLPEGLGRVVIAGVIGGNFVTGGLKGGGDGGTDTARTSGDHCNSAHMSSLGFDFSLAVPHCCGTAFC